MCSKKTEFFTLTEVYTVGILWYGKTDIDTLCIAENRLMDGKRPSGWEKVKVDK